MNMPTPTSRFILNQLVTYDPLKKYKILDYGCGRGALVRMLRENGYDAYGADIEDFWEEDIAHYTDKELFAQSIIKTIKKDGSTEFEDHSFDILVSDMVVEHVSDKDNFFKALDRLLKPDGKAYLFFPVKEAIREGHIKQFFIHWFPKGKLRYQAALLQLKLGICKKTDSELSDEKYVQLKLDGIDENTHYERFAMIRKRLKKVFEIEELETDFLLQRLADKSMAPLIPLFKLPIIRSLINATFRRYSFAVVRAEVKKQ